MATTVKELIFKIIGDNEQFNKSIAETTQKLKDFEAKTKDANELFGKVAKQATIATTAIVAVGVATAKMAIDFNEGFGKVQTLIPGATERIKELQANVLELSPAVGKTTKDLTEGLYEIISAFGDSADSAKTLEVAAKGATAGGATTKEAIKLLSAVTKAYGDTSAQAQGKVSDLAFVTLKLGQTSMSDLATSMQRVTSMSKTLGVSQEELFAIFSSGTGVVGGAAEVSTQLSAVYTEMLKPGEALKKAFSELGVATGTELIEKFGGVSGALTELKKIATSSGVPISNLFGSVEAGKIALYATGEGAQKLASDLDAMAQAAGATDQAFSDATVGGANAFGFQLQQAGLNAQTFAIKLGQEVLPVFQPLLNVLSKGAETLAKLDEGTLKNIASIGKIVVTATAVTAGVMGVKKAIDATKGAMIALKGAFAANPLGLFIVGVATAIVAIKELCSWLDRAAEKKKKAEEDSLRASLALPKEAESLIGLSKGYIELSQKEKLSAEEKIKLQQQTQKLIALAPELAGKLSLEEDGYKNNLEVLKKFNAEKIKEIELTLAGAKTQHGHIVRTIEGTKEHIALLKEKNTLIASEDGYSGYMSNDAKIQKETKALDGLIEKEKIYAEEIEKNEILLAQLKDSKTALDESTAGPGTTPKPDPVKKTETEEKTQGERLAELDALYGREKQIIENRNTTKEQKDAELLAAEKSHYQNRLKMLEEFNREDMQNGYSLDESKKSRLANLGTTILSETEKTNTELNRMDDARHRQEIEQINKTTAETKKHIEAEIQLKKEAGLIDGKNENEIKKNALLEAANAFREKQNDLLKEYLRLLNSGNQKDEEKADAIKSQADALGGLATEADKAAKEVDKSFSDMAKNIAAKMADIGTIIADTFSGIADVAKSIIGNKQAQAQQETAHRLAEINKERNETLLAIDSELADKKEQKQIEDAEREELRRQEEHEKTLAHSERTLTELQGQFELETNLEKLRNQEKQIEEARKKQAEELARKKAEDEKIKRDKEARMQEVALLNAKASAEHEFAVARINTENAAGDASAKAAQESAKWQKAQGVISLSIKAAIETANAVAAFAIPFGAGAIQGAMHTAAAVMAGIQAGVIAGQPQPPDYSGQPLPPAPRPIKFAQGGIVMPSASGTGITLPNGNAGLVAEAGSPELILPVNLPNLEAMFKAAGFNQNLNRSQSLSYSPNYQMTISQNASDDFGERLIEVLQEHDRDVYNIMESARLNWRVGD